MVFWKKHRSLGIRMLVFVDVVRRILNVIEDYMGTLTASMQTFMDS